MKIHFYFYIQIFISQIKFAVDHISSALAITAVWVMSMLFFM